MIGIGCRLAPPKDDQELIPTCIRKQTMSAAGPMRRTISRVLCWLMKSPNSAPPAMRKKSGFFRERYHIELRRVAGDEVRIEAISHMIGYNEIALPEIERRFGKDILQKVADEAKANYEKQHKQ